MGELQQEFLKQSIFNLETLQREFAENPLSEDFLRRFFRILHTIKGTSNTFNFFYLAKLAHEIEDFVQAVQNNQIPPEQNVTSVFREGFVRLLETAQNYLEGKEIAFALEYSNEIRNLLPAKSKSNDLFIFQIPPRILSKLSITEKDALNLAIQKGKTFYLLKVSFALQTFYEDFKSYKEILNLNGEVIAVASTPNSNPTEEVNFLTFFVSKLEKQEVEKLISRHSAQIDYENDSPTHNLPENLGEVLINLVNYGKKTAQFLNKTITFETNFTEVQIPTKQIILLNEVASHLLHNAIDHAIEPLEERILIGKNSIAKIKISLEKLESEILFEIEDDGSGIDIEKIIAIAKEKGLVSNDEVFTEKEAFELIFSQGFSTSKTVSEISGRGVGLDAVKDLVEKSNGRIEVKTKDGFGSTFSVYLSQI